MANTFDNQKFVSDKKKTQSVISPSISSRHSSLSSSHSSLLYEQNGFSKSFNNQSYFKSSHQLPLSSNDSSHNYQRENPVTDDSSKSVSENYNSDTKPPPPARMPRIMPGTNNNYARHTNPTTQISSNRIKTNTTYLNAAQLYIAQPLSPNDRSVPYSLQPPPIPSRNPSILNQKNSIIIPHFNSFTTEKTIYRSSVKTPPPLPPTNNVDNNSVENKLKSLSIDNNHDNQETTNPLTAREYFGECAKCGETVSNLDDPCDILGQIYHGSCAVCVLCGRALKNQQFYLHDDLYCEEDFLYANSHENHERCCVCDHTIEDRVIQALGQSYHMTCFKCSKCSICLDGLPFLKDKHQNLLCLNDYYKSYGVRCDKCLKSICPKEGSVETVRITSMGKNFHVECYQCEDCSMQLNNEIDHLCHPLDDTLLCEQCYHRRLGSINKF